MAGHLLGKAMQMASIFLFGISLALFGSGVFLLGHGLVRLIREKTGTGRIQSPGKPQRIAEKSAPSHAA